MVEFGFAQSSLTRPTFFSAVPPKMAENELEQIVNEGLDESSLFFFCSRESFF
jgi:hypothetical protein